MMSPIRYSVLLSLCTLVFCNLGLAAEPLWLSDDPPKGAGRLRSSHGGPVEVRKGVYYKHLWLRRGEAPMEASYLATPEGVSELLLLDTQGNASEKPFEAKAGRGSASASVSFPMPEEGFYNAYAMLQRLDAGVREVQVAKAEVLKHSCREGHDNVQPKMPPRHNPEMPLEIVRERQSGEDFHSRVGYGDSLSFLVLRHGIPQPGAKVVLTSGQGWSKQLQSDDAGRVSYTMIRDYYPPWKLFEKRHAQPYMVHADYTLAESGALNGTPYNQTRYLASFSGRYYPSPDDYQSYAYGLSFGLFAMVATGWGVTRYRRRRNRPYREVRFHE